MKWIFSTCERQWQNISLLAAGVLAGKEADEVRSHLAACADCRSYFKKAQAVVIQLADCEKNLSKVEPSLAAQNRWRRAIEAARKPQLPGEKSSMPGLRGWWLEVIWPSRRIWAGLAAVWVLVLAGHASLQDSPRVAVARPPVSQMEMVTALKDRQQVLAELLGDHAGAREAVRQKLFKLEPRTQRPGIFTA